MWFKKNVFWMILVFCFFKTVYAQDAEAQKKEIYSKLNDKYCTTMPLDRCNCPAAQAMKAYIDAFLETGMGKDGIFLRVAKKYSIKVINDEKVRLDVEKRMKDEVGGKYAIGEIEDLVLNFGVVSKKQDKASKVTKIYNKGNIDLIITNLRVSCDCVRAALKVDKTKTAYFGVGGAVSGLQVKVAPGKFAELEVVLDLNHSSMGMGRQVREVFISSNNLFESQSSVISEIEVKE